jgi:anti-sigma regulatory factor (Ser/Thr protein kinase)
MTCVSHGSHSTPASAKSEAQAGKALGHSRAHDGEKSRQQRCPVRKRNRHEKILKRTLEHMEIKIANRHSELVPLNQGLTEVWQRHGLNAKVVRDLNLAIEEIVTNIISHAFSDNREHIIRVRLDVEPAEVRVEVEDDGRPFNPLEAPDADTTSPLEERPIGALGIHLVRKLTDGLDYKRQADKNLLTLKKKLQGL